MDTRKRRELRLRLRELLEPVVVLCGCELVSLEIVGSMSRPTLRVYIDKKGGVNVDDCAKISSAISPELDAVDPLPSAYELEVSSPGIERPVERPQDFARFAGYRARIKLQGDGPRKTVQGVLGGWEEGHVLIDVGGERRRILHDEIERARLDLTLEEFMALGAADAPGRAQPAQGDLS